MADSGTTVPHPRRPVRLRRRGGRRLRRARPARAARPPNAGGLRDRGTLPDVPRARPRGGGVGLRPLARPLRDHGGLVLRGRHRALLGQPLRHGADRTARARRGDAARRRGVPGWAGSRSHSPPAAAHDARGAPLPRPPRNAGRLDRRGPGPPPGRPSLPPWMHRLLPRPLRHFRRRRPVAPRIRGGACPRTDARRCSRARRPPPPASRTWYRSWAAPHDVRDPRGGAVRRPLRGARRRPVPLPGGRCLRRVRGPADRLPDHGARARGAGRPGAGQRVPHPGRVSGVRRAAAPTLRPGRVRANGRGLPRGGRPRVVRERRRQRATKRPSRSPWPAHPG